MPARAPGGPAPQATVPPAPPAPPAGRTSRRVPDRQAAAVAEGSRTVEVADGVVVGRVQAMASAIAVQALGRPSAPADRRTGQARDDRAGESAVAEAVDRALGVFETVAATCTRFDPASPLMVANADPDRWHSLPPTCASAIAEAHAAYLRSEGRFDPRVLEDLVGLGYTASLSFAGGGAAAPAGRARRRVVPPPWQPRFRGRDEVHLGGRPLDLGGIGKGLAVRWAAETLRSVSDDHLVEAGGDCTCSGHAPDGGPWRVGVEDPAGGSAPLAVLGLADASCATSSVRLRRWTAGDRVVHHLIDPRTGLPGGPGMAAVTVVAGDPAEAEVWSKVLFLSGRQSVAGEAARRGIAALWVTTDGAVACSEPMARYLVWQAW